MSIFSFSTAASISKKKRYNHNATRQHRGLSYTTWTRWGGRWTKICQLLSTHVHGEKYPREGRLLAKKGQNYVHVVIEWPHIRRTSSLGEILQVLTYSYPHYVLSYYVHSALTMIVNHYHCDSVRILSIIQRKFCHPKIYQDFTISTVAPHFH